MCVLLANPTRRRRADKGTVLCVLLANPTRRRRCVCV